MAPSEIADRAKAIRLQNAALARLSKLVPNTVSRVFKGRSDPRWSTQSLLEQALIADELRLRDYLLALHPIGREGVAS